MVLTVLKIAKYDVHLEPIPTRLTFDEVHELDTAVAILTDAVEGGR